MNRFSTKLLVVCLLGSAVNFAFSQEGAAPAATRIVIGSGLEGGGYWNAGNRLQAVASGMGLTVENQSSIGSIRNLTNLLDKASPVSLVFAQADALQYYLKGKPDAALAIETLANIGEECVFIITNSDSGLRTDEDLQETQRLHLGIKSPNSGIRVTFDYMKILIPELANTTVNYGDAVEMMNDFEHPKTDVREAVMVVHGPNERSPEIDMVIADPDRYRFVKLTDERLTQKTSNGEAIYHSKKVAPGAVESAGKVETICVQGLLLANKNKLSVEQRNTMNELISNHWAEVHAAAQ